ncbi:MAG: tRNA lysidine(34) synthetase TilS [Elainella sp. Prado103]|jgi:tRNA(Ile)-lysidine synthase|nr:tRNA lysidine(34) synthetase TilS [Elainella sp. Prado103]
MKRLTSDWSSLHAQIHRTLKQRQLLPIDQTILIAVSGGQDSLCLLKLLQDLRSHWGWQLGVAHCNHRWRADSAANAAYVRTIAEQQELPYYEAITTIDLNSEATARSWRYQQLTELAIAHGYGFVATGHTASDRAETLLYNLVRGSGLDGLQSLSWQRSLAPTVQLVRPLLEVQRQETAAFCEAIGWQVWQDSTNQDCRYARNRMRLTVLPYLKQHFNPQVETALSQTAELLRADREFLEAAGLTLWQQAVANLEQLAELPAGAIGAVDRQILRLSPLALQRRALRQFLKAVLSSSPNFDQVEKLQRLVTAPNRSQSDPFPGNIVAQVAHPWIILVAQAEASG